MGVSLAVGTGIGTALFAATQQPFWIGVGAGIGAAFGVALMKRDR